MILYENLTLLIVLISVQTGVNGSVIKKDEDGKTGGLNFFGGNEEVNLEREILQEINHLNPRKQREIFDDLEKQNEKFNVSQKSLVLSETENLSPLNVEELKSIRKTIKASNSSLPAIRNKRTLNFLLQAFARAMGYTLTPSNPDAEWIPRQQPPPAQPCSPPPSPAQPCSPPPPPCSPPSTPPPPPCSPPSAPPPPPCSPPSAPPPPPCSPPSAPPPPPCSPPSTPPPPPCSPPSTPPPCAMPPTTPPCTGSLSQPATIPPNQIDPNTIRYPYRPARTIPLFNFAPLPAGLRVPYPPLLQPPARQTANCPPQQPSPPPCGTTPAPPCGTPPPSTPAPCKPSPPPPCSTPAPPPPPCGSTPAPNPPPCQPPPPPPCGTTPAPKPQPCQPTPAPCPTPAPSPPPCPSPSPPPCASPAPPPCGSPPPSPPPPSNPPKKGSILLEYEDPVRIQIFSNDKKYLPVSGNIFSGHDEEKKDWQSYFYPENETNRKKDEDFEEKEEVEEEHVEEEENEESPGQLKHYEEEDERVLANEEEEEGEENESETNLSIVKKPLENGVKNTKKLRMVTKSKTVTSGKEKKNANEEGKEEKPQKMKKPKRKKWIRIVKKQRRKTKTDSNPSNNNNFQIYTSDSFSEASQLVPKYYEKRDSEFPFDSYERDSSDFFDDSSSRSSEDVTKLDLKKVIVNNKQINSPELLREARTYEFNFNPYALEPEEQRRKKLEKAVERYVEDYVEKQLGNELIKNTGVPKTTVFEFAPKNGPKIQTITTTVAKTSGNPSNFKLQTGSNSRSRYQSPTGNAHVSKHGSFKENLKKRGDVSYEDFSTRI